MLLKNLVKIHKHILFVWESGINKTVIIQNYLKLWRKEKNSLNINFFSRINKRKLGEADIEDKYWISS